jgi:hypothetical protein
MLVVATSAHASHVGLSRLSAARATPGALIRSCLLQRLGLEGLTGASDVRGKRVEVDCGCARLCEKSVLPSCKESLCESAHMQVPASYTKITGCFYSDIRPVHIDFERHKS